MPLDSSSCFQMPPDASRCLQMFPDGSRCFQMLPDAPRCLQMLPRCFPEGPQMPPDGSQMRPICLQMPPSCFLDASRCPQMCPDFHAGNIWGPHLNWNWTKMVTYIHMYRVSIDCAFCKGPPLRIPQDLNCFFNYLQGLPLAIEVDWVSQLCKWWPLQIINKTNEHPMSL